MGWKYFLLIICWSAVFVPIIYFYFPETAQLSLEEIEKQFGDELAVPVRHEQIDQDSSVPEEMHKGAYEG